VSGELPPEVRAWLAPILRAFADVVRPADPRAEGPAWVDARSSGIGVRVFRREAKAGSFPVYQVGKRWVAKRADVDRWIESRRIDVTREGEGDEFDRALARGRLRSVGGGRP
jgi:hypothetical protein